MNDRKRYSSPTHAGARFVAQQLLMKPFIWTLVDVKVHGKERLQTCPESFIIAGNHTSHLDTPLIIGALPRRLSRYLATGAAADHFFQDFWKAAPTALFFNAFPVDRGKGLRGQGSQYRGLAGRLLNDGVPLLLFPEGTRSRTMVMGKFKPGVAALCISRDVPCVPVALIGAGPAMPHNASWVKKGRPKVHVVFGDPMWARPGETAHQFSDRISAYIRELHDDTARAYGLATMNDLERAALEQHTRGEVPTGGDQEGDR